MFTRSLSVVVPAFDEADCIGLCLDLLCEQLDCITEIIVVDNNSTDDTEDIVKRRAAEHPEIRYMAETQQGLVFARNAGHCDRTTKLQTLPEALEWVWRGYPQTQ
jgi:glycosyltransferase involved in cell wall biosynthesis